MPRRARERSSTGIYHIMHRGINKQDIFIDNEDRLKFLWILQKNKSISKFELYGYCLMSNHIHLLLKETDEPIFKVMKRIGTGYAYWFNQKYERCGHLFQDRYKSEKVEDERYLLTVLRYIHQNPVKAGISKKIYEYKWSSCIDYISVNRSITDADHILDILNPNRQSSIKIYKEFMTEENQDSCLDYAENSRKINTDKYAKDMIMELVDSDDIQILHRMKKHERDDIIRKLKAKNISIRCLARITGLNRNVIAKA